MRRCSECGSLVAADAASCPSRADRCPLFPSGGGRREGRPAAGRPAASRETVRLSAEQLAALTAAQRGRETPEIAPRTARPRPSHPRPASRPRAPVQPPPDNPAARLGYVLGFVALFPFFPIAITAVIVSLIALVRSTEHPSRPGRQQALIGLFAGLLFGTAWLLLTLWFIVEFMIR